MEPDSKTNQSTSADQEPAEHPTSVEINPHLIDPQGWDDYWNEDKHGLALVYQRIATAYRNCVIRPQLNRVIRKHFSAGAHLLHAGCGSGQVDADLQNTMRITALDICPAALRHYVRNNPKVERVQHGSILNLPFPPESFDGVYNLGVIEHFSEEEIARILSEFRRVLRPGGRIILFWPHACATSVFVLRLAQRFLKLLGKKNARHCPPTITYCHGRGHVTAIMERSGLKLCSYEFGLRDFFVQAVVVARK